MTTSLQQVSQDSILENNHDSHSVNTGLNGDAGIVHVATNVSEDLKIPLDINSFELVVRHLV